MTRMIGIRLSWAKEWLKIGSCWLLLMAIHSVISAQDFDFLSPEKAFSLSVQVSGPNELSIQFEIAPEYYLYKKSLSVTATGSGEANLGELEIPPGEMKDDLNFGRTEVYHRFVAITVPIRHAKGRFQIEVNSQGCAEKGICYPPQTQSYWVELMAWGGARDSVSPVQSTPNATSLTGQLGVGAPSTDSDRTAATTPDLQSNDDSIQRLLIGKNVWAIVSAFLVAGLLLSLTPCVLPMVPILSSVLMRERQVEGEGTRTSKWSGFKLSLAYVLGMALVYAGLGVVAGMVGEGLAGYFQHAWVWVAFAALMVLLSLSMFGVYELQLPYFLRNKLNQGLQRLPGGAWTRSFAMGGFSALLVSPCVAAPLAAALVYVSQTRDVVMGGIALFVMAVGMGMPLLIVGATSDRWLPKSGAWMVRIKHLFGFVMLGMASWVLSPLWSSARTAHLVNLVLVTVVLIYIVVWWRSVHPQRSNERWIALMVGFGLVGLASLLSWNAWENKTWTDQWLALKGQQRLSMQRIQTNRELQSVLQSGNEWVMLDFYADWCVSCKEMEAFTFSNQAVQQRLAGSRVLQVDVTKNTTSDQELLRRFGLFGPPGLILFDPSGQEIGRVVGFKKAEDFVKILDERKWAPPSMHSAQ